MSSATLDGGFPVYETADARVTGAAEQHHGIQSEDLYTSRHNPDFRTRNHDKIVRIQTILSGFMTQLRATSLAKDQPAFDDLFTRISIAGHDLEILKQPQGQWRELKAPDESEVGASWPGFTRLDRLWRVEHPESKTEGPRHDELYRERVVEAKRSCRESRVRQSETLGGLGFFDEDGNTESDGEESLCSCATPNSSSERAPFPSREAETSKTVQQSCHVAGDQPSMGRVTAKTLAKVDLEAGRQIAKTAY